MEMCYTGTLVLPSSYAVMDMEEMTYVEGGGLGKHWYNTRTFIATVLDVSITLVTGVSGALAAARARNVLNTAVSRGLTKAAAKKLSGYIGSAAAKSISTAISIVSIIGGWSLGGMLAYALDRVDGRCDGYIFA